jgi:hypothetical protein
MEQNGAARSRTERHGAESRIMELDGAKWFRTEQNAARSRTEHNGA